MKAGCGGGIAAIASADGASGGARTAVLRSPRYAAEADRSPPTHTHLSYLSSEFSLLPTPRALSRLLPARVCSAVETEMLL